MARVAKYHHGNLRAALLDAAASEIAEHGAGAMSLRKVAARVGVTHPAAAHHFGDKTGVLTALAAEGYRRLAARLREARARGDELLESGVAYVRFAHDERAYFEVMYRPELLHVDDPELVEAKATSSRELGASADATVPARATDIARGAWSFAHGFATLWLSGNLGDLPLAAAEDEFRRVARAFTSIGAARGD